MTSASFQKSLEKNPTFSRILDRHSLALFNQAAQSVACNRLHTLDARCARWLLMTHVRMRLESFTLTHEFLSYMPGVHRPAVTLTAGVLQRAGLIRYTRGKVTVLDRDGLEAVSYGCYDLTRRKTSDWSGPITTRDAAFGVTHAGPAQAEEELMANLELDASTNRSDADGDGDGDSRGALRAVIQLTLRTDLRRVIGGCPIEQSGIRENSE